MAYDPEARETSNSAMIIGIVALVLVIGAVLAYYATRRDDVDNVVMTSPAPTTVVETQKEVPVAVPVPTNPSPPVVVTTPAPTTRIEKSTTITRDTTRVVPSGSSSTGRTGGSGGDSQPKADTNTNVTINAAPSASTGSSSAPASGGASATDSATKGASGTTDAKDTDTNSSSAGY